MYFLLQFSAFFACKKHQGDGPFFFYVITRKKDSHYFITSNKQHPIVIGCSACRQSRQAVLL